MNATKDNNWLLPVMVVMITAATIYLSIKNNTTDVVYSLCTAIFGYYFGSKNAQVTTTVLPAATLQPVPPPAS